MTPKRLLDKLAALADRLVADRRCQERNDGFGVAALGMILFGYGLGVGRLIVMLDIEDIKATVSRCLSPQPRVIRHDTG